MSGDADIELVRREDPHFPDILRLAPRAPEKLYVAGGSRRLGELLGEPTVAIVGTTRRASDYGMETARGLARGLAASGITILSGLAEGIPAAAHMGALEAGGTTVTVMAAGLDICHPATKRALYRRIRERGCAISEFPPGSRPRHWQHLARMRIVVASAQMVILVEAEDRPLALEPARLAEALGRTVGAVPGRVSSPLSRGPHALLAQGACLIRDPQDALDALYGMGVRRAPIAVQTPAEPRLQAVFEQVSAGRDTLAKLTAAGAQPDETLVALSELELTGALVRGDGGRYMPRG